MLTYIIYTVYKCATGKTSWAQIKAQIKEGKSRAKGQTDEEESGKGPECGLETKAPMILEDEKSLNPIVKTNISPI